MKNREVVVFILVFMFIFSITGNMSSAHMNKSKISFSTLDETIEKNEYDIELSAKDFVSENEYYIDTIVLFKEGVKVTINDLEIEQEYKSLNGFAGKIPCGLYYYLRNAWFVDAIQENSKIYLSSIPLIITNRSSCEMPTSDDDLLSWGIDWINAEKVWGGVEGATDVTTEYTGQGIKVGIIDSGIDYDHEDLNDNIIGGYNTNTDSSELSDLDDTNVDPIYSHGTHCAGIIAAEDNGFGVIGVAPEASIYVIKIPFTYTSEYAAVSALSHIIEGIDKAIEEELDILSISAGLDRDIMSTSNCSVMNEAVNRAVEKGIIVVCAAGNHFGAEILSGLYEYDPSIDYPAACENSIAVGCLGPNSLNPDDIAPTDVFRWSHSDKGPELDFMAPGVAVISTVVGSDWEYQTGTSMACPMVAGVCALILDVNPLFSPYDVKDILIATAGDLGATGHDNKHGYGQIDAWDAFDVAMITPPSDSDNDGLYDREEMQLGTDRFDSDTDNDGLTDFFEVNSYLTSPLVPDADCDSLDDGEEYALGTDPRNSDTDGDVMLDPWEVENGLNPLLDDTGEDPDGDGLLNIAEYHNNCDPQDADTDNDGLSDGEEVLTYNTNPWLADTDGDGLPDGWEINNNFNPHVHDSSEDADGDGASNLDEYYYGTDPNDSDTDNDGMNDLEEIIYGTNPFVNDANLDPDGDGLTNYEEVTIYFTNPFSSDTDGDGWSDYLEIHGIGPLNPSDPNDPNSVPSTGGGGGFFP